MAFALLIPVGLVGSIVWLFEMSAAEERRDPGGMSGEWLPLATLMIFAGWTALCLLGTLVCGLLSARAVRRR